MQIQFATKRGTNTFRGQVFDQISDDRLNANGFVNAARGIPKTKLRQHEWGANFGGPIIKNKLFFFGNYEQIYSPSEATHRAHDPHRRGTAGRSSATPRPTDPCGR